MVKHIVLWKLSEGINKEETIPKMKQMLENLVGIVPGLIKLEVNANVISGGFDAVLYSEFDDMESLKGYQTHPAHLECKKFIHTVICDRTAADYEA